MGKSTFFRRIGLSLFIFLVALNGFSQNTKRAYKLLEKADYAKAVDIFKSVLADDPVNPAAVLGMMLTEADEKSPDFSLVSAWKYGSQMKSLTEKLTADDLEYIGEYFYNTEERHINRPVKKKIEYAAEAVEAKLIKYIREENNLELVYAVLKEFPDFRHYDNVIHIRNQLEFRKYEKMNTLEGYQEFLNKFPEAAQQDKARKYIYRLAFENAVKINTPEAYKSYIQNYPQAEEVNQAVKRLHAAAFEAAKKANTIQAMENYMQEFPDALEIAEARIIQKQLLYEYAKKIQTLEAYNEFIRRYPEGQQYIDIFNLKSLDNGMRFLSSHPVSNSISWARSFEQEDLDEISSYVATDSLNNYITVSTVFRQDTGYTDAWIIKTDADGKMIWNKFVGEPFNDEIFMIAINGRNDIFGAGYTWSGIDSLSREAWIFKQGADGNRIWSRKLGKMHITNLLAAKSHLLLAGGYLVNDSLQDLYSIVVLNDQGKRLWGRTYTGKGRVTDIDETRDGEFILTGTRWFARINASGYLKNEYRFQATDSVFACIPSGNAMSFLVKRDSVNILLVNLDASGNLSSQKMIDLPKIPFIIESVAEVNNTFITLNTFADYQSINVIQVPDGKLISSVKLPSGMQFSTITADRKNNLLITGCNSEIILIKNNGTTF